MSLLNEMLQDIARQNTAQKPETLLKFIGRTSSQQAYPKIILLGLLTGLLFLLLLFLMQQLKLLTPRPSTPPGAITAISAHVLPKPRVLAAPHRVTHAPEPPRISYIVPLSEYVTARESVEDPFAEGFPIGLAVEEEERAVPVVKEYATQTLTEWLHTQVKKGVDAVDDGQDEKAIVIFEKILAKVPTSSVARENLASLYLVHNNVAKANEILNKGLDLVNDDPLLLTIKSRILIEQGRAPEAIILLSKARPPMDKFPDFYATLAAALQAQNRTTEAGSLYKALLQIEPNNGQYWLGYGLALEENHKLHQAIDAYNHASASADSEASVRVYAENRLKTMQG